LYYLINIIDSSSQIQEKETKELSNTLMISELGPDVNLSILDDVIRDKCLELQTSMPEDIRFMESIHLAFVVMPSIPAATKLYECLRGSIYINGNYYPLKYTPNLTSNSSVNQNKTSTTYITSLNENSAYTTSMETTVHEDWICEFVNLFLK
jgi:hypothetical protein